MRKLWMYLLIMGIVFMFVSGYRLVFDDAVATVAVKSVPRSNSSAYDDSLPGVKSRNYLDLSADATGLYDHNDDEIARSVHQVRGADRPTIVEDKYEDGDVTCHRRVNVYNISKAYLNLDNWQTVIKDRLYVYSAHVDPRRRNLSTIRIFGIIKSEEVLGRKTAKPYYCQIYSEGSRHPVVKTAKLRTIQGHNHTTFRVIELACQLPSDPWTIPRMVVSVTTEMCTEPNNHIVVRQNYKNGFKTNFTLCLDGVLKHGTAKSNFLVEWIELNVLLGADHVFVYNFTGSAVLDPYLKYYRRKGLITVLPWDIPIQFREDEHEFYHDFLIVWNYAQRTMIHDCLYRNMFVARHLVYLDLDEFIIPQEADVWTWQEMMNRAEGGCTGSVVGSYVARNGIFDVSDGYGSGNDLGITTAAHTTMQTRVREAFARTKYILIPEHVLYLNVHVVDAYYNRSFSSCVLPPSIGHVHHYKWLDKDREKHQNFAAVKFKARLIKRMNHVYDNMKT